MRKAALSKIKEPNRHSICVVNRILCAVYFATFLVVQYLSGVQVFQPVSGATADVQPGRKGLNRAGLGRWHSRTGDR